MITVAVGGSGFGTDNTVVLRRGTTYRVSVHVISRAGASDKKIAIIDKIGGAIGKLETEDSGIRLVQAGATTPGGDWLTFDIIPITTGAVLVTVYGDVSDVFQIDFMRIPR